MVYWLSSKMCKTNPIEYPGFIPDKGYRWGPPALGDWLNKVPKSTTSFIPRKKNSLKEEPREPDLGYLGLEGLSLLQTNGIFAAKQPVSTRCCWGVAPIVE